MDTASLVKLVEEHPNVFLPQFAFWLGQNRHVFDEFEEQANKVWEAGRRHYSARTIIEVIRHETAIGELNGEYKINNLAVPDLARLYILLHPERKSLFELRDGRKRLSSVLSHAAKAA